MTSKKEKKLIHTSISYSLLVWDILDTFVLDIIDTFSYFVDVFIVIIPSPSLTSVRVEIYHGYRSV